MTPECVTVDFETAPARARPFYPPQPIGVAIKWPRQAATYYGWGHVAENNATFHDARAALAEALDSGLPLLCHNAKFDLDVLQYGIGIGGALPWRRVHDTTYLAFLLDPHGKKHGLKDLAARYLNEPPTERDAIREYVYAEAAAIERASGRRVVKAKGVATNAAEFLQFVPGTLVGAYCIGDVERTAALFDLMYPEVERLRMLTPYERERQLLPIWRENERRGMRVDTAALERDVSGYSGVLEWCDSTIRAWLRTPDLNIDADQQFARALISAGMVQEARLERTEKTGAYRVGKDALPPDMYADPLFASLIGYRNRLTTCVNTFMSPWLAQAQATKGRIHTNWHSTRGGNGGTRSGRPSTSDHNFLNLAKSFEGRSDGYVHPAIDGLPPLPLVRNYVLPDEGCEWLHRDFNGQELRIFAHFEDGALANAYRADPRIDVHGWIRDTIKQVAGVELERTRVKNVTFARLYGGGVGAIETQARCANRAEAEAIAAYHDAALPGRRALVDRLTINARLGEPMMTWGGRLYWPEEPLDTGTGRLQTYEYKLINYLVQGSAADYTKQCLLDWYEHKDADTQFMVTVYDELNICAPYGARADAAMGLLKEVMEYPRLSVPMVSDGKRGPSWGGQEKCD